MQTGARLLEANYYPEGVSLPPDKRPRLRHVGLDVDGLSDALGMLGNLIASGALTADDALEDRIRRTISISPAARRTTADRLGRAEPEAVTDGQGGRPSTTPRESR